MVSFIVGKGKDEAVSELYLKMANRHGLIAGATGTGKTVTLQHLAEEFSKAGVPVFVADVKGDLSGLAVKGKVDEKLNQRFQDLGIIPNYTANPVVFWDMYAKSGHPLRTTVSEVGPLLLSRIFDLSEVQTQVLELVFNIADEEGLELLDLKDLNALLIWVNDNLPELKKSYGNIAPQTIGAIQRRVINLEKSGGSLFFGEPALKLSDFMRSNFGLNGLINVLDARTLLNDKRLYSTFLLWLLSELFEELEEAGDLEKPRLVFFFDEAHLLFNDISEALLDKIDQVVRLIRSKGVGIYFITQNPRDIPENILAQLGNRIQHALRAYTPSEQKALKAAAAAFRENPVLGDTEKVIMELSVGEALVSTLDSAGVPKQVERVAIIPPVSLIGAISEEERSILVKQSPYFGIYEKNIDRESAFEVLKKRKEEQEKAALAVEKNSKKRKSQSFWQIVFNSFIRSFGSRIGRELEKGLFKKF